MDRQMDRLFAGSYGPTANEYPAIELWSGEDGVVMHARLPGLTPSDIDLSVVRETVTLKGERPEPEGGEKDTYHRRERDSGRFVRAIQLPFPVDGEAVKARFEDGILEVELPRAQSDKPKTIPVKTH
jgi:HSP20 family protein